MTSQRPKVKDMETITFDKCVIEYPKGDLSKAWKKLERYMDIMLEDYKYEESVEIITQRFKDWDDYDNVMFEFIKKLYSEN